jgi:hypothetical protein
MLDGAMGIFNLTSGQYEVLSPKTTLTFSLMPFSLH